MNPIEVALEEVGDRLSILGRGIKEMEKISNQESKFASQQTTMELSGTIDAAGNGGFRSIGSSFPMTTSGRIQLLILILLRVEKISIQY